MKREVFKEGAHELATIGFKTKKRSSQAQIWKRRKEMMNYDILGYKPKNWKPILVEKYGVPQETLKRDWSNRKNWISSILQVGDINAFATKSLMDYEIILADAFENYENTNDIKTKTQILWLISKVIQSKNKYLKEIGVIAHLKEYTDKIKPKSNKLCDREKCFMEIAGALLRCWKKTIQSLDPEIQERYNEIIPRVYAALEDGSIKDDIS